jgi:hypothetical protein
MPRGAGQLRRRLGSWWRQTLGRGRAVRAGRSLIDARGLFAARDFAAGTEIGALELGPEGPQGKHTLRLGGQHRRVRRPWRYINHACQPSACLRFTTHAALLIATRPIAAGQELTIDYGRLPETPSVAFECRCPSCIGTSGPTYQT